MQFPFEGIKFLQDLEKNNRRDWFAKNKGTYHTQVQEPSAALRVALVEALSGLVGSPIEAKTFRLNRDLRFSKDKPK